MVRTDTDEVRASRKMSLELLLSDHVGDCVGPCTTALSGPVRHSRVPFASRRGRRRAGGAIASDLPDAARRAGPRLPAPVRAALQPLRRRRLRSRSDRSTGSPPTPIWRRRPATCRAGAPATGKRVSIVGAGPAGLTAAYHLLRRGHDVTVLDAHRRVAGGMLRYGIPAFRLPPDVLAKEIDVVTELGGAIPDEARGSVVTSASKRCAASRMPSSWHRRPGVARPRLPRRGAGHVGRRDAGGGRRRATAAARRTACSSSAAATPRWTSPAPRFGSARRSRSSTGGRAARCRA